VQTTVPTRQSRPASRAAARIARPRAFTARQYSRPTPTSSRRHGWFAAGGFTVLGFTATALSCSRTGRVGSSRQHSFVPR